MLSGEEKIFTDLKIKRMRIEIRNGELISLRIRMKEEGGNIMNVEGVVRAYLEEGLRAKKNVEKSRNLEEEEKKEEK